MEPRGKSRSFGPPAGGLEKRGVSMKLALGSYLKREIGPHMTGDRGPDARETRKTNVTHNFPFGTQGSRTRRSPTNASRQAGVSQSWDGVDPAGVAGTIRSSSSRATDRTPRVRPVGGSGEGPAAARTTEFVTEGRLFWMPLGNVFAASWMQKRRRRGGKRPRRVGTQEPAVERIRCAAHRQSRRNDAGAFNRGRRGATGRASSVPAPTSRTESDAARSTSWSPRRTTEGSAYDGIRHRRRFCRP